MKLRNAVLIFSAILVFLSGASPVFSQDRASLLQERCNFYYQNIAEGQYGNMWDMSRQEMKDSTTREEYVAFLQKVFDNYTSLSISSGYDQCAKPVEGRDDLAISKAFIYFKNAKESIGGCNLLVFLWLDDNWYFSQALACEYENDVESLKNLK